MKEVYVIAYSNSPRGSCLGVLHVLHVLHAARIGGQTQPQFPPLGRRTASQHGVPPEARHFGGPFSHLNRGPRVARWLATEKCQPLVGRSRYGTDFVAPAYACGQLAVGR